jgi:hypothetical protein
MAVKALVPLLVTLMLVTGVCNTLLTKYQVHLSPVHKPSFTNSDPGQYLRSRL